MAVRARLVLSFIMMSDGPHHRDEGSYGDAGGREWLRRRRNIANVVESQLGVEIYLECRDAIYCKFETFHEGHVRDGNIEMPTIFLIHAWIVGLV